MIDFFRAQLDYFYFIYGLSFVLFGIIALVLRNDDRKRTFFLWLGLFGVLHGVYEFFNLAAVGFHENIGLSWLMFIFRFVSFICLGEFARSETEKFCKCRISRGVLAFLSALVLFVLPFGDFNKAGIFTRYFIGFPAGIWASFVIFRNASSVEAKGSKAGALLGKLGILFGLYALTQIVVPPASFFPASFFNQDSFLNFFRFPVHLLKSLLACFCAFVIFIYYQERRAETYPDVYAKRGYVFERIIVGILGGLFISGWLVVNYSGNQRNAEVRHTLVDIALAMSASIDPVVIRNLFEEPADEKNETYQYVRDQLERVHLAMANTNAFEYLRCFYILTRKNGHVVVGVDSCRARSSLSPSLGCIYKSALGVERVFDTATAYSIGPFSDEGVLSSAGVAPILDEEKRVIGVISVVVDHKEIDIPVARTRLVTIVIISLFITIFLIFIFAWVKMREAGDDIAQQRAVERKLRLLAESASQAKSQFLANMSHEIRTPINAVLGFTDLLQQTQMDAQQKDYLNIISDSGHVLLKLIDDILDVSRIEAGQLKLEELAFDLEYLIASVMKMIQPRLKDKKLELLYDVEAGTPAKYVGDPTRLRQIFLNLLNNAIKFTSRGYVKLSIGPDPGYSQAGPYYVLRCVVEDTGIGIPKDKQEQIFESFAQADTSTTRQYGGAGLGLFITKMLVERMNGTVKVESEEGKGSKFILSLRFKKMSEQRREKTAVLKEEALSEKKVAVLDDNRDSLCIIEKYLQQIGVMVVHSSLSPGECLNWLSEAQELPDVLLCDILMPEMDGYGFAGAVRADARYEKIKLIAMTSEAIPGTGSLSQKSGFNGYLPKPIVKSDLKNILQGVLAEGSQESASLVTRHSVAETALQGAHILVVEDNPTNLRLTLAMLEKFDCITEGVVSGEEAIERIREKSFQAVLMDLQMPGMGGLEATFVIRRDVNKTIPIIGLSAAALKEDEASALAMGMSDYLSKPVSSMQLKEKLIKWIAK